MFFSLLKGLRRLQINNIFFFFLFLFYYYVHVYLHRLRGIGVENIWQLSLLSDSRLQTLTEHDHSFEDYRDFMRGVANLKSSKIRDVEKEMLIHHKADINTPGSYSLLTFILMGKSDPSVSETNIVTSP